MLEVQEEVTSRHPFSPVCVLIPEIPESESSTDDSRVPKEGEDSKRRDRQVEGMCAGRKQSGDWDEFTHRVRPPFFFSEAPKVVDPLSLFIEALIAILLF